MKTVYSTLDAVAHEYAVNPSKRKKYATNSTRNFYFRGRVLYSYGEHWPLAVELTPERKESYGRVFAFNTSRVSQATAKHASIAHRALPPDSDVLYMEDDIIKLIDSPVQPDGEHGWIAAFSRRITSNVHVIRDKARRRRKGYTLYGDIHDLRSIANSISILYKLVSMLGIKPPGDFQQLPYTMKYIEKLLGELSIRHAELMAKDQEREARRAEEHQAAMEALRKQALKEGLFRQFKRWKKGEINRSDMRLVLKDKKRFRYVIPQPIGSLLRLIPSKSSPFLCGNEYKGVETFQGVRIPRRELNDFWRMMRTGTKESLTGNNVLAGRYQINFVGERHIRIGCHKITYREMNSIAKQLGWPVMKIGPCGNTIYPKQRRKT